MSITIKLKKPYMGHEAGTVMEVSFKVGKRLIADGHAVEHQGGKVRPMATKIKTPESGKA